MRLHARPSIFEGGGSGICANAATAVCRALPFKVLLPILNTLLPVGKNDIKFHRPSQVGDILCFLLVWNL